MLSCFFNLTSHINLNFKTSQFVPCINSYMLEIMIMEHIGVIYINYLYIEIEISIFAGGI